MTLARDDVVFRPRFKDQRTAQGTGSRLRAREGRRIEASKRKGTLRKIAALEAARRFRRARRAKSAVRMGVRSGPRTSAIARGVASTSRLFALVNPLTLGLSAVVATIVAAERAISGGTFENLGAQFNKIVLGDLDDVGRASEAARDRLAKEPNARNIAGFVGLTDQMRKRNEFYFKEALATETSRSLFLEDPRFKVQSVLDMLLERLVVEIKREYFASALPELLEKLKWLIWLIKGGPIRGIFR